MSGSSDDELPDIAIGTINNTATQQITRIDVDAEIADNLARKELKKKITVEISDFTEEVPALSNLVPAPEPTISSIPPHRKFFHPESSFKSFNSTTVSSHNICPSEFNVCTSSNVYEYSSWIRSKLKTSCDDDKRRFLQYLWVLMSCHPDPFVIQKCCDMLVEYNSSWRLKYDEVILVFKNWGVALSDFLTNEPIDHIDAELEPHPIVTAYNVENVLRVVKTQLSTEDLAGTKVFRKTVFILLSLLTLDKDYSQCLSDVSAILEQLAVYSKAEDPLWVENYCQGYFEVESHHSRLAYLAECVVPRSLRWCLCLTYCQQTLSLAQTFQAVPHPLLLLNILDDHMDTILKLKSWELHSFISIVDTGISLAVSHETDYSVRRGFLNWLSSYMERRIERRSNDIDVDASYLAELVSRLLGEWESAWQAEPGAQDNSVQEVEFGEMYEEDS